MEIATNIFAFIGAWLVVLIIVGVIVNAVKKNGSS